MSVSRLEQQCPGCEAEQKFPLRQRPVAGEVIEVYISCTICPFEMSLRRSTKTGERLRVRRTALQGRIARQEATYGTASPRLYDEHRNAQALIAAEDQKARSCAT